MGLLLVVGYTYLSGQYFIRGMDNMIAHNMQRAGELYLQRDASSHHAVYLDADGFGVAPTWEQVPAAHRAAFPTQPVVYELHKYDGEGFGPPEKILFLLPLKTDSGILYITHSISPETVTELVGSTIKNTLDNLLLISGITALSLIVILFLLIRRIFNPVSQLREWTRKLDPLQLEKQPPDFSYPELNELADIIRSSLQSVQESLHREHQFLRHTSHELRTPISTIRSNVELLYRLYENNPDAKPAEHQVVERLDRASQNMRDVTETLLWLSKDNIEQLPSKTLQIDRLIEQCVAELDYLLHEKQVALTVEVSACALTAPEVPLKIVLSNLIRNAFQHTWEGHVHIVQNNQTVKILNENKPTENGQIIGKKADLGFGLGLKLTAQLCDKLNWRYQNIPKENGHHVSLDIGMDIGMDGTVND
ncbi:MAG: HAMP domain-containing histidine kinase [Pseudomonadales bacterium]|nr:HAMP domain-containing histidine kinase [Pseudomonadales bacterium]